jgi:hypothetical protein
LFSAYAKEHLKSQAGFGRNVNQWLLLYHYYSNIKEIYVPFSRKPVDVQVMTLYIRHILPEENLMTGLGIVMVCVLATVANVPGRFTIDSECGCLFCSLAPVAFTPLCVRCDVTAVFI